MSCRRFIFPCSKSCKSFAMTCSMSAPPLNDRSTMLHPTPCQQDRVEQRWSVLLPLDPVEDLAQALSLVGVDRFDEGYTALQVHPKAGVPIAVLALRTQANTVGEYRS